MDVTSALYIEHNTFCEGAGDQRWIEMRLFSYQRSPFIRGDLSGMPHVPQKNSISQHFYHKKKKKTTQIKEQCQITTEQNNTQ